MSVPKLSIVPGLGGPPAHLSAESRRWWEAVVGAWDGLEPHDLMLLQSAAESWDSMQSARKALAKHGSTYLDRFGQPKVRPEVAIARDARLVFARLVRSLKLEDPGQPAPPRNQWRRPKPGRP